MGIRETTEGTPQVVDALLALRGRRRGGQQGERRGLLAGQLGVGLKRNLTGPPAPAELMPVPPPVTIAARSTR